MASERMKTTEDKALWGRRGFLAALASTAPALAWAHGDRPLLWQVSAGAAKVFLFGDAPSLTPWRSPRVEAAFSQSATFWKETPDPGPGDYAKYVAKGVDHQRPLSTWLTADERSRVAAAATTAGTTYAALEPLEPWLAAGFLSMAFARGRPALSEPLAILTQAAKSAGKPVRTEYPDIDSLIAWASGMSPAAQVQYLFYNIEAGEAGADDLARRIGAVARGDLTLEAAEVARKMRNYPLAYEADTGSRNRAWPARFRTMLAGGGTTFVLVGVDHLVGPQSVLVELARAGMPARRL